ncbi:hypothetical protein BLA24_01520 [Streptomyces cinnamoneus]|uniref:WXG100 family type VII secretion target n=1 Tax=Streptomyces cinnamoneus TaxID=53446 RepID=A0A2G1XQ73_STRCJ|nr:hypothetical protein [Streptomyces cinnamoneus]PHQ53388.1 hypothetical protein BLA24_01520 [Streptomyces cinnamoneus]
MTQFVDVREPTACLKPPGEPEDFLDPLESINAVCDVLTPGSWLLKLAELMLPRDPVAWAQEQLAGDWKAYAKCSETWRRAGQACDAVARNIDAGVKDIDATWDGNAAEAALRYFDALRGDLEEFRTSLQAMGDEYLAVAQAVSAAGQAIGECIGAITDALVTGAIAAAASTALGWTGWAAAMGYALGAQRRGSSSRNGNA